MAASFTKLLQNVIKCYCAKVLHFFAGKITFLLQNMLQKVSGMPLFVTICVIFFGTKCSIFAPSENYTLHHFVINLHHGKVALCIILLHCFRTVAHNTPKVQFSKKQNKNAKTYFKI